ncbi:MAG: hypothetical protein A2758_01975 [Candidatus Zambryskibacteria bacterium RIFCSPHIGHO2_01_FULL_49_18]|uniref:Uncharacterized protein n=2 Tax=Candidatus Zambryskiibacteriota TaxID=1817925 RepID=A0A1G2T1Q9_9BACT|nr:MAG: hypothetical protein A2758_01975 [Candidatus Zambryskibacteria bacterium RIFCSPHIGHO2_01_FULL_49_18]OHB05102.1 MAG: hypothetical protein A3A26_00650 [Candidatus Zambryskibacteria bacterium RIFCSPLOWO2_01_FULL_47_14]
MKKHRLLSVIFLILAVIFLPYYIYLPALLVAIIVFPLFWEGILIGSLIDALYGSRLHSFASVFFTFAFYSFILVTIIMPVRRRIRSYAQ